MSGKNLQLENILKDTITHKVKKRDSRKQFFFYGGVLIIFILLIFIPINIYVGFWIGVYLNIFQILLILVLLYILKNYYLTPFLIQTIILISYIHFTTLTFFDGGFNSTEMSWYIITPVFAFLLSNKKAGFYWSVIVFITLIFFFVLDINGMKLKSHIPVNWQPVFRFMLLCSLFLFLLFIIYYYQIQQKKAYNKVREMNLLYIERQEAILSQNEFLRRQQEEIRRKNELLENQKEEILTQSKQLHDYNQQLLEKQEEIRILNENLEEIAQRRTLQLKEAYQDLDTFLYRSSHDLRRPLTTLMGLAEVARVTIQNNDSIDLFDKVDETAKNMDKMLSKLRMVSDTYEENLSFDKISFGKIIRNVQKRFQTVIDYQNIAFQITIDKTIRYRSNDTLIHNIIFNLVENSLIFYLPSKPQIDINISQLENQSVQIAIRDNGQGIDKEYHGRIFDMYFRANEGSQGNGLGLYVVKKAVERLQGQIQFESVINRYTEFRVILPLSPKGYTDFSQALS